MDKIKILEIVLKIATFLSMIAVCFVFFQIIQAVGKRTGNIEERTKEAIDKSIKESGMMKYQKQKLSKMGVMYRVKDYNLNPSWYIMARIAVGVVCVALLGLLTENIPIALIGLPAGYILTEVYFKRQNEADNKAITMDLYNTYANLKIQMDAGCYIVDSIEYIHKTARHPRYKEALGELILNFSDKTVPMSEAIDIFRDRFDSKDIDKLCALLQSCVLYGAQKTYARDIMGEIQGIILASTLSSEHDIETKAGLINFVFFTILIFITVYSIVSGFGGMEGFL